MIVPFDLIDFYFCPGITRPAGILKKEPTALYRPVPTSD
jgi:hypothetical protein